AALALCAVTGGALLTEYFAPVTDAAASRRQVAAVATDIDVPARDLRSRRDPADPIRALGLRARPAQQSSNSQRREFKPTGGAATSHSYCLQSPAPAGAAESPA